MARVTTGNFAFSMDDLDLDSLLNGDVRTANGTTFLVDTGGGELIRFNGSGFTYNALGEPVGGTITSVVDTLGGQTLFQLTEANVSAVQFYNLTVQGDGLAVFDLFLGGNDTITGGPFGDLLGGFGGHDNLFGGSGADGVVGGTATTTSTASRPMAARTAAISSRARAAATISRAMPETTRSTAATVRTGSTAAPIRMRSSAAPATIRSTAISATTRSPVWATTTRSAAARAMIRSRAMTATTCCSGTLASTR